MMNLRLTGPLSLALLAGASSLHGQTMQEMHTHAKSAPSTKLQITVDGKTSTVTLAELAAMPQKTVKVHNEHTKKDESYTGVALADLLAKYGFAVGMPTHRKMLHSYLAAEGTDKYWVLYSVTEIEPSEHDAEVIVATSIDGQPLGDDGQLKLVASAEKRPQRWVRNLTAIRLVTVGE
ncbi:MAG TPA: hypothetical protein VGB69_10730 [Edaphobacter sp.]